MLICDEFDCCTLANMRRALEETCRHSVDRNFQTHEARSYIAQAILEGARAGDRSFNEMLLKGQGALFVLESISMAKTISGDAVEAQPALAAGRDAFKV